MDAIERLNKNFLSCCICLCRYEDPCTLPCQHTFCKKCLADWMEAREADAKRTKAILCPFCKKENRVRNPQTPVKQWPKQFKSHILVQGLLDEFNPNVTPKVMCIACQQSGQMIAATFLCCACDIKLCDKCSKIHKAMPDKNAHVMASLACRSELTCKEHVESIEFLCQDCNKKGCKKCCQTHPPNHSIVKLKEVIEEKKSLLLQKMESMQKTSQDMTFLYENDMRPRKDLLISEIRMTSQEAINRISLQEEKMIGQLDDLLAKEREQLKAHIKSNKTDMQVYQKYWDKIENTLKPDGQIDLCDTYLMLQSLELTEKTTQPVNKVIYVKPCLDVEINIGFVTLSSVKVFTTALHNTIDIKGIKDKKIPDPNDILVLVHAGVEILVVTDSSNMNVKSFYIKDGKTQSSSLQLEVVPFTISKLSPDQVVISFYNHLNVFGIVKVDPELSLVSQITTRKAYRSITSFNPSTLVAGCYSPPSIDIIDMTGKVLKSLNTSSIVQGVICKPWYLYTTGRGHIMVSDEGSTSVYCLTGEGELVFMYKPTGSRALTRPLGITSTIHGDILVADYSTDKITQLTETGFFVREILTSEDGISRPQGVCLHQDNLYITQENNKVMVFRLNSD